MAGGRARGRWGRCDPSSLPDSRAGPEPAPALPSRVSQFPESGNDRHSELPSSSVVPCPGSRRLNRRPSLWPDGKCLQKSGRGRCWHKCRETQRGARAADPCPSPRGYGFGRTLLPQGFSVEHSAAQLAGSVDTARLCILKLLFGLFPVTPDLCFASRFSRAGSIVWCVCVSTSALLSNTPSSQALGMHQA